MRKPKKKFGQTTVAKSRCRINQPTLGNLVQGNMSIEQVIGSTKTQMHRLMIKSEPRINTEAYESEVLIELAQVRETQPLLQV